jgi:CubicO group peptidase (beta-lactamase class C family)
MVVPDERSFIPYQRLRQCLKGASSVENEDRRVNRESCMKTLGQLRSRPRRALRDARARVRFLLLVVLTAGLVAGCGGSGADGNADGGSMPSGKASLRSPFGACPPLPSPQSPAGSIGAIVDGLVANEMQSQNLPGMAVGLAKQGNLIYAQGYGYADLSACAPTQVATPFQLDSVTKQFTAAAVLQLQSAGALDIDGPVAKYLPSYPFDPRITLRMLLNQISGLSDYINDGILFPQNQTWTQGVAEPAVLTAIAYAPLQFTPGSAYQYSNSNYFALGSILETISSEAYSDYLATQIIGPSGLTHASYAQPLAGALPYTYYPTSGSVRDPIWDRSFAFSAGALWSDVQDLARWDAALLNGQVISPSLFTEMVTPPSAPSSTYAMGWARGSALHRPFVSHTGGSPGGAAYNGLFLDNGLSISVLMNAEPPGDALGQFVQQVLQAVCTSSPSPC